MLKKDILTLCLLQLLTRGDQYGYEMLRRLHMSFSDTQESAIYAILRELCRNGYTQQYEGSHSEGPVRKYYRLTEAGRALHADLRERWRVLRDTLSEFGLE